MGQIAPSRRGAAICTVFGGSDSWPDDAAFQGLAQTRAVPTVSVGAEEIEGAMAARATESAQAGCHANRAISGTSRSRRTDHLLQIDLVAGRYPIAAAASATTRSRPNVAVRCN